MHDVAILGRLLAKRSGGETAGARLLAKRGGAVGQQTSYYTCILSSLAAWLNKRTTKEIGFY